MFEHVTRLTAIPTGLRRASQHVINRVALERKLGRGSTKYEKFAPYSSPLVTRFRRHVAALASKAWCLRKKPAKRPMAFRRFTVEVEVIAGSGDAAYVVGPGDVAYVIGLDRRHLRIRLRQSWVDTVLRRGMVTVRDSDRNQWVVLDADRVPDATGAYRCLAAKGSKQFLALPGAVRKAGRWWRFTPDASRPGAGATSPVTPETEGRP
jgi:hypothetical protein